MHRAISRILLCGSIEVEGARTYLILQAWVFRLDFKFLAATNEVTAAVRPEYLGRASFSPKSSQGIDEA